MKLGTGLQGTLLRLYGVEEFSSTRWLLHTLGNVIPIMYENDKTSQCLPRWQQYLHIMQFHILSNRTTPSRSPNVNAIARLGISKQTTFAFYPGGRVLASTKSPASRSISSLAAWRGDRGIAMRPVRAHSRIPKGAMSFKKASILAGFADLLNAC